MLTKEDIILLFLENPYKLITKMRNKDVFKSKKTRELICSFGNANVAYIYSLYIDESPHDLTRKLCCTDPKHATLYALKVDREPRYDTWASAQKDPYWSSWYAMYLRNTKKFASEKNLELF